MLLEERALRDHCLVKDSRFHFFEQSDGSFPSGITNQNVGFSDSNLRSGHQHLQGLAISNIRGDANALARFRADLSRNSVAVGLVATRNNDASSGLSQNRGNGTAHSFGSAGYERNASREIKCIQRVGVHFVPSS